MNPNYCQSNRALFTTVCSCCFAASMRLRGSFLLSLFVCSSARLQPRAMIDLEHQSTTTILQQTARCTIMHVHVCSTTYTCACTVHDVRTDCLMIESSPLFVRPSSRLQPRAMIDLEHQSTTTTTEDSTVQNHALLT